MPIGHLFIIFAIPFISWGGDFYQGDGWWHPTCLSRWSISQKSSSWAPFMSQHVMANKRWAREPFPFFAYWQVKYRGLSTTYQSVVQSCTLADASVVQSKGCTGVTSGNNSAFAGTENWNPRKQWEHFWVFTAIQEREVKSENEAEFLLEPLSLSLFRAQAFMLWTPRHKTTAAILPC